MMSQKGYHRLIICTRAKELIKEIYLLTEKFPRSEVLGLSSQLRRAVVSVLLNIVEGQRRNSQKDFARFLDTADASLAEVEVCLEIAIDLKYITAEELEKVENKRREVAVMLVSLIKTVKKSL